MNEFFKKNWRLVLTGFLITLILYPSLTAGVINVTSPGITDKTKKAMGVVLESVIDEKLKPVIEDVDKNTMARIRNNIKDIEKQYEKLMEKPNDLYTSNLKHLFDNIIPATPTEHINETLRAKIKVLKEEYEKRVTTGQADIDQKSNEIVI